MRETIWSDGTLLYFLMATSGAYANSLSNSKIPNLNLHFGARFTGPLLSAQTLVLNFKMKEAVN